MNPCSPSKGFLLLQCSTVLVRFVSRDGKRHVSFLSDLLTTIYLLFFLLFPSFFFTCSDRLSLLFSNCDVGPSRIRSYNRPFYSARTEHYIPSFYNSAMTERRSTDSQRVNFLQIGILLQFAGSSIILALRGVLPASFSLFLQLLFMSSLPLSVTLSLLSVFC